MLETIDRYSVKANGVVNGMYRQSYDKFNWAAITGGVPPQFVVGIVVNKKLINAKSKFPWMRGSLSEREYVEKVIETARICGEMFNVPVFDEAGNIIYHAKENVLGEE